MKRIAIILYFLFIFAGISLFFFSFASYLFDRQEEMQLFIPDWSIIAPQLLQAGMPYIVLGMFCTQFFCYPLPAALLVAFLVCAVGVACYLFLQRITDRGYNLLLALFPVFTLMKAHIQPNYVIDGTIAYLIGLLLLVGVFYQTDKNRRLIATIIAALFIYWVAAANLFPLTDELQAKVWLLLTVLLLVLFVVAKALSRISWKKKRNKWLISSSLLVLLFLFSNFCLPNRRDVQNRMIYQLDYLSRRQNWDAIIAMHINKRIPTTLNLNYLNMALAQKGVLADRLFFFDQRGPEGLLPPYDFTYHSSILLSDIHFYTADISLSESYAMEALTLARRNGSPRALKRLVQISLIRHEWQLADKYLYVLKQMPAYKEWASRYETYIGHPEKFASEPELAGKRLPTSAEGTLLSMLDIKTLWSDNLHDNPANRTVYQYLGCSYLLGMQMDKFKDFLLDTAGREEALPIHFQEAALVVFEEEETLPEFIRVSSAVRQRYDGFMSQLALFTRKEEAYKSLYKQYGNTFWFYYHFKFK